jgi:hypothetical protein
MFCCLIILLSCCSLAPLPCLHPRPAVVVLEATHPIPPHYGIKQSAKLWADTNANGLQSIGYTKSKHDDALWFRRTDRIYVTTHVDDFKVYAANRQIIDTAKQQIMNLFPIKDLGSIRFYLDMKVDRNREARTIQLTQTAAIDRILDEAKLTDCSPCQTLMEHGL